MLTIDNEFKKLLAPLLSDEREELERNILARGCLDPLKAWQGVLIDGHNRYEICTKHALPYKVTELSFNDRDDVIDWIIDNQIGRRNLTQQQTSYYRGVKYERLKKRQGGRSDREFGVEEIATPKTADVIAEQHGVSERTVRNDAAYARAIDAIAETAGEEVKQQILTSELNVTKKDVLNLASKPAEKQAAVLEKIVSGEAKSMRDAERLTRKAETAKSAIMPSGKYRVIYADPPWKYGDGLTENYGGTQYHYPSMSIDELCAMPIKEIAEDNAVLFMWVTSPLLEECFPIIRAWGFKYKSSFVWDKIKHNMGHYNSVRHEFLLVCTRGSCTPDEKTLIDSVQSIERTNKHSEKPEEFRRIIETIYNHGSKLELFARQNHEGWFIYGNQLSAVS